MPVSNYPVGLNDEFDYWPVDSGERFRTSKPSCLSFHVNECGLPFCSKTEITSGYRLNSSYELICFAQLMNYLRAWKIENVFFSKNVTNYQR